MVIRFHVLLQSVHQESGLSLYRVQKDTGIAMNTVVKYAKNQVYVEKITVNLIRLIEYYGVEWTDVIKVVHIDEDGSDDEETKTLLAA